MLVLLVFSVCCVILPTRDKRRPSAGSLALLEMTQTRMFILIGKVRASEQESSLLRLFQRAQPKLTTKLLIRNLGFYRTCGTDLPLVRRNCA